MKHLITLIFALGLFIGISAQAAPYGVGITAVDSSRFRPGTDSIMTGGTFNIYLKFVNDTTVKMAGLTNGWRIFSPDGATWTQTDIDSVVLNGQSAAVVSRGAWTSYNFIRFSVNGLASDTVGIGLVSFNPNQSGQAMEANTTLDSAFVIKVGTIPAGQAAGNHGKTICIDSTWYRPAGEWVWGDDQLNTLFPDWSGQTCWTLWDEETAVRETGSNLPNSFALSQNYPNPFNPSTEIKFDLPEHSHVSLKIYNILGQEVRDLVNEDLSAGTYREQWDGRDDHGKVVTTGVYFYKLQAGTWSQTKKMTFIK